MEQAEILSDVAEYDPKDETFLEEDFSNFLSKQEQLDFNLTTAIKDLVENVEEELQRVMELKFMTDYLQKHDKIRPYLLLHRVFTPTFIYDEMKNAGEKISWKSVSGYCDYLYTNGLLFLKADVMNKMSKRNIQLYWIPGTPKKLVINKLRKYLQLNAKTSYEQVKANSKKSIRAVKDAGVEVNKEFADEQTKIHREKKEKQLEQLTSTTPKKSSKSRKYEEKKELIIEMASKSKPIDYEKKLRDDKIKQESFLKRLPTKELVAGINSPNFKEMPIWYQELAKKIFKERTGDDIVA